MQKASLAEFPWRIETTRSKKNTLWLAERRIHSAYNSVKEAEQIAQQWIQSTPASQHYWLIGSGLGYLTHELRKQLGTRLTVWDPFVNIAEKLQSEGHLQTPADLFSHEKVSQQLKRCAQSGFQITSKVHPGMEDLLRFEARWFERELRKAYQVETYSSASQAVVSERALDALLRFPRYPSWDQLGPCLRDQAAILVASGPSLQYAIPALQKRRGGVLIAGLRAIPQLLAAGIKVDFAIASDPLEHRPYVEGLPDQFDYLLVENSVEAGLQDRWPRKTVLFHLRSPQLIHQAWRGLGLPIFDEPSLTVSECALNLAHAMGARQFILLGMDFCGEMKRYRAPFPAIRSSGETGLTNPHYFHAARYFAAKTYEMTRDGCQVFRFGDGLQLSATTQLQIDELTGLLERLTPYEPPAYPPLDTQKRASYAKQLLHQVQEKPAIQDADELPPGWEAFFPLLPQQRRQALELAYQALDAFS